MPKVSEVVAHILLHIESEVGEPSPAHMQGMAARAQKVRDLLGSLKTDDRRITRKALLRELRNVTNLEMKSALLAIDENDSKQHLDSVLREWVETGQIE